MERHTSAAAHDAGRPARARRLTLALAVLAGGVTAPAQSVELAVRTHAVSLGVNGAVATGASTRPAVSEDGSLVAFDSTADNLALDPNGTVRDVFVRDVVANTTRLVSQAPDGGAANGVSSHAAIGGDDVVAFESDATNLVEADFNGVRDVFARSGGAPIERISVATDGGNANGPSTRADLSADGRRVVFVSTATNLVAGDTNGQPDIFVRDRSANRTQLVSRRGSTSADGPSVAPAISPDGRYVTFSSSATNLVSGDGNGVPDVFIADLETGLIELVSVSSQGRQQNRAVIAPFEQVSDVSRGGRYVVFDSDATNLVRGDRNADTDVFLRDRGRETTGRVSVDQFGIGGDNDSFNPVITPNGRLVAFESFASRLAPGDGRREDVFVYDVRTLAPSVMSVPARGGSRGPEQVRQLLQRPAISSDGDILVFTSTAENLVSGDTNDAEDVFVRLTLAPRARIVTGPRGTVESSRPRLVLRADDRKARAFICSVDGVRFRCDRSGRLPRLRPGNHVLRVWAGGAGMLYQARPLVRRFRVAP